MSGNYDFQIPDRRGNDGNDYNKDNKPDDSEGSYKRLLGDKPITWFWLMQHYSKENAAAYKAQKEARKTEKRDYSGQNRKRDYDWDGRPNQEDSDKRQQRLENLAQKQKEQVVYEEGIEEDKGQVISEKDDDNFGPTVILSESSNKMPMRKIVLDCLGYGQRVAVGKIPYRIGRDREQSDLCLADNTAIGRNHAEINIINSTVYITDINSKNHVFVNGVMIQPMAMIPLKDGDAIRLANEEFIIHITE